MVRRCGHFGTDSRTVVLCHHTGWNRGLLDLAVHRSLAEEAMIYAALNLTVLGHRLDEYRVVGRCAAGDGIEMDAIPRSWLQDTRHSLVAANEDGFIGVVVATEQRNAKEAGGAFVASVDDPSRYGTRYHITGVWNRKIGWLLNRDGESHPSSPPQVNTQHAANDGE